MPLHCTEILLRFRLVDQRQLHTFGRKEPNCGFGVNFAAKGTLWPTKQKEATIHDDLQREHGKDAGFR